MFRGDGVVGGNRVFEKQFLIEYAYCMGIKTVLSGRR